MVGGRGPQFPQRVGLRIAATLLGPALSGLCPLSQAGDPDGWETPFGAVSYGRMSGAGFEAASPATTLESTEFQLAGGARFRTADRGMAAGVDYQYTHYGYTSLAGRDRDLHRLQFPLRHARRTGNHILQGTLAPGVATSSNVFKDPFGELTSDDLLITGGLSVAWDLGHRSGAYVGLVHDRAFGDPALYPVAGVEYCGDRSRFRLAFPDPSVTVRAGRDHTVEARLYPAGQQWHVVSEELGDDFDYEMRALRTQLTWSWRLASFVTVDLAAGLEFARHHEFTDDQGTRHSTDADDEVFVVIALRSAGSGLIYSQRGTGPGLHGGWVDTLLQTRQEPHESGPCACGTSEGGC